MMITIILLSLLSIASTISAQSHLAHYDECKAVRVNIYGKIQLFIGNHPATLSGVEHILRPSSQIISDPTLGKGLMLADHGIGAGRKVVFTAAVYAKGQIAVLNTLNQGKYNIIYKILDQGQEVWYYSQGSPCIVPFQGSPMQTGRVKAQSIKLA